MIILQFGEVLPAMQDLLVSTNAHQTPMRRLLSGYFQHEIVMERMRENLREFLECKRNDLSPQTQLQICLDIMRGLCFLHTHTPLIIHRDLTDKNVMFGKDGLVKIGDLGQSRLKAQGQGHHIVVVLRGRFCP